MAADKGKKLIVAEKVEDDDTSSDHIDDDDDDLVISIEKLQEIQDQLEKLSEEASDELLVMEQKYNEIRKPVYEKRNEIIKSIPDFWLTAFLSHPALSELFNEEDQKIFKYLSSLEVKEATDVKSGYSISFIFNPNPYFEDAKLTKTFTFLDEGPTKVTYTPIRWKEGMAISNGTREGKGNKRPLCQESFFSWFNETSAKGMDNIHDEIAEIIREDLWPNPLIHFNNEGDGDIFEVDDDDDEEGEGEDGSEDEDGN